MTLFIAMLLNISSLLTPFRTQAIPNSGVSTVRILVDGEENVAPVVSLDGDANLTIMFDDLSFVPHNYYYRIVHCDASWMPSDILDFDYLEGLNDQSIDDYTTSMNTAYNYINYSFSLPNDYVQLKLSGNYAVLISRDNDFDDNIVAVACFSLVEHLASLDASFSATTLKGINSEWQQVEVVADVAQVGASNPMSEFRMVVRQNNRMDNEVVLTQPTYFNGSVLRYVNMPQLVFEAGNQYRSVDFSSRYTYGSGIDRFVFTDSVYTVMLEPDLFNRSRRTDSRDAHGAYVVHVQGDYDDATEADYMWVRFFVPTDHPFFEGRVYLLSGAIYNIIDNRSMMRYDNAQHGYTLSLFLKQGGMNYQYIYVPKRGVATLRDTEGNFWQTNNSYQLFLYYRPFGSRYDRLVGYGEI